MKKDYHLSDSTPQNSMPATSCRSRNIRKVLTGWLADVLNEAGDIHVHNVQKNDDVSVVSGITRLPASDLLAEVCRRYNSRVRHRYYRFKCATLKRCMSYAIMPVVVAIVSVKRSE